ncbi:MAG TPA: 2-oxo-4-hydroxy-4-carboxy-5-ureidoimidazoline decarboxylase [Bryobacteraceae bacterium]|jgi:2-oxo-4-hydroxy-4-carboxy-5-ureidoimidazoline decarboxylase|nr:2-oxo-4-hydroxy-4-carboxy-5-ureidoimidazoline decarboxylase [Bryobacteraceae bacterium]
MTLDEFNRAAPQAVQQILFECCASGSWVNAMSASKPFRSPDELYETAEKLWWSLESSDWLEAFAKHPKIGERKGLSAWSSDEQRGMDSAADVVVSRLARKNVEYFEKFGWIFLICATGKKANEMLNELERRLLCDRDSELRTAAAEQAKITRLRLAKALNL